HDFVRYRVRYSATQLDAAMGHEQVFWAHPIPRRYDDPLRSHVRRRHGGYEQPGHDTKGMVMDEREGDGLLLTLPILKEIRSIEGWLSDSEADLLMAAAARAMRGTEVHPIVEIGSYCGKSTVALGRVALSLKRKARICAIDPHEGLVGAADQGLKRTAPTL